MCITGNPPRAVSQTLTLTATVSRRIISGSAAITGGLYISDQLLRLASDPTGFVTAAYSPSTGVLSFTTNSNAVSDQFC